MKRVKTGAAAALAALLAAGGASFAAGARDAAGPSRAEGGRGQAARCTVKNLRGAYGFIAEGTAGPPAVPLPQPAPLAGVGTVSYDPRGGFTLTAARSVGGVLDPQPLTLAGSYTLDADCTLTMNFDVGFTFRGTVVAGGDEILFVETDAGTAAGVRATSFSRARPRPRRLRS